MNENTTKAPKLKTLAIVDWREDRPGEWSGRLIALDGTEYDLRATASTATNGGWMAFLIANSSLIHSSEHGSRAEAQTEAGQALRRAIDLREGPDVLAAGDGAAVIAAIQEAMAQANRGDTINFVKFYIGSAAMLELERRCTVPIPTNQVRTHPPTHASILGRPVYLDPFLPPNALFGEYPTGTMVDFSSRLAKK